MFREWVTIPEPDAAVWERLLAEARAFAAPAACRWHTTTELAERIRQVLSDLGVDGVREQKMFGGLAFLVGGHMAVAASREGGVLLSVDRGNTDALLEQPHTRPMVMRGREMAGWVRVDARRRAHEATARPVGEARRRPRPGPAAEIATTARGRRRGG